jgi:hypothetical protein
LKGIVGRGGDICGVKRILSIQIAFPINRFLHAVIDTGNRKFGSHIEMTRFYGIRILEVGFKEFQISD